MSGDCFDGLRVGAGADTYSNQSDFHDDGLLAALATSEANFSLAKPPICPMAPELAIQPRHATTIAHLPLVTVAGPTPVADSGGYDCSPAIELAYLNQS